VAPGCQHYASSRLEAAGRGKFAKGTATIWGKVRAAVMFALTWLVGGHSAGLGQVLGDEFLECRAGVEGLYYDPETEKFVTEIPLPPPEHVITTTVKKRAE